jgi:ABC-type dipeptide/oligopeptide/nickel transport system ATPase component
MVDPPQGCAFGPRCSRRDADCARQPAFTPGEHKLRCFHPLSGPASLAEVAA